MINPQPIDNFHKNKYCKDGLASACKVCRLLEANEYNSSHREERLSYAKEAYEKDPEKFAIKNKQYSDEDPKRKLENNRKGHLKWYYQEENRKGKAKYYQEHKEEKQKYDRKYKPEREKRDPAYKMGNRLRSRMNMALKRRYKSGSAVRDLGCSIDEFVKRIESLWKPGMTWDNYGNKKDQWSLDHIDPLSSFDLTDRKQFLKGCHYSNIRPMWHIENVKKGNKKIK